MCQCLEFQFDAVISDRRMILHCMHLVANLLQDHDIITSACIFQCMCQCLEFQFNALISDRRMILHCMHLLANLLQDHDIITIVPVSFSVCVSV